MSDLTDQMRALARQERAKEEGAGHKPFVSDALRTAADRIDAQDAALAKVRAVTLTRIASVLRDVGWPGETITVTEWAQADAVLALIDTEGEPPNPSAEPPRIEDMTPGTTFEWADIEWTVAPREAAGWWAYSDGGACLDLEELKPSEINHVRSPKEIER